MEYSGMTKEQLIERILQLESEQKENRKLIDAMRNNLHRGFNCLWSRMLDTFTREELNGLFEKYKIKVEPGKADSYKNAISLADELLKPEEIERSLLYIPDWEIDLFTKVAVYSGSEYEPSNTDEGARLLDIQLNTYLYYNENHSSWSIPIDVGSAWLDLNTPEFNSRRAKASYVYACSRMVYDYFSIIPLADFTRMVQRKPECSNLTEAEVADILEKIPEDIRQVSLTRDRKMVQETAEDDEGFIDDLLESMKGIPYYLFSPEEVQECTVYGYPQHEPRIVNAEKFLRDQAKMSPQEAADTVYKLWESANQQETSEHDDILDKLSGANQSAWASYKSRIMRNTRTWAFRGHTYNEYLKLRPDQTGDLRT